MTEKALTTKLRCLIRDRGGWCRKTHGGPHGAGWPDLIGVYRTVPIAFEVKLPGKEFTLTELQQQTLIDLRLAGAVACMVTSTQQVTYILGLIDAAHWRSTPVERLSREALRRHKERLVDV